MDKGIGNYLLLKSIILKIRKKMMNTNEEQINSEKADETNFPSDIEKSNSENTNSLDDYNFGWSTYSEITNGRFAMLGFFAIILIEFLSKQSFLKWAGLL